LLPSSTEKIAEHLHSPAEVDAHRIRHEAGSLRNFGPRHAFHQAKNQGFAIGLGELVDGGENGKSVVAAGVPVIGGIVFEWNLVAGIAKVIDRAVCGR
jgi:hypothetical protein